MQGDYTCIELLKEAVDRDATDLLLSVGHPPQVRVSKNLVSLDYENLTGQKARDLAYEIMNEAHQKAFENEWEVDFSIGIRNLSRFRVNVFHQRNSVSAAFRRIPFSIMGFDELGLPPVAQELAARPNGLILVTGPTGSGKSTTLAAMIDWINETRDAHIITIEDPIEYLHAHKRCTVDQREVGTDTKGFHNALRSILRQDPDVVMLGEMRDIDSIQAALTIAETGHLCFATLHTNSASQTLSRIIDVFPGEKQSQVRTQLAMSLNGVFTQALLPKLGGGLHMAVEVMVATGAVRALIRENKIHNIDNQIKLGRTFGMQTMNQSLAHGVKIGAISEADALAISPDHDDYRATLME